MTKIKLVDGTIINAESVELVKGVLQIIVNTTITVEELAEIFSDKENTSLITLMTESGIESGYKTGFTSFAGINYDAEGVKTVELFQPKDVTEERLADAEGAVALVNEDIAELSSTVDALLGAETGV